MRAGGDPLFRDCHIYNELGNGLYSHKKGRGAFYCCTISDAALPTVALRTLCDTAFVRCAIATGKDKALLAAEGGGGNVVGSNIMGYASKPIEIKGNCHVNIQDCVVHDGMVCIFHLLCYIGLILSWKWHMNFVY